MDSLMFIFLVMMILPFEILFIYYFVRFANRVIYTIDNVNSEQLIKTIFGLLENVAQDLPNFNTLNAITNSSLDNDREQTNCAQHQQYNCWKNDRCMVRPRYSLKDDCYNFLYTRSTNDLIKKD